jgi:hypothetical protein
MTVRMERNEKVGNYINLKTNKQTEWITTFNCLNKLNNLINKLNELQLKSVWTKWVTW